MAVDYQFICNSLAEDPPRLKMNVAKLVSALKGALSRRFCCMLVKTAQNVNREPLR